MSRQRFQSFNRLLMGKKTNDCTVALDWSNSSDAGTGVNGYRVQVDNSSSFGSPEFEAYPTSSSGTTTCLNDGYYYWRVRAQDNADNWSSWSSIRGFRIDRTAPSAPTLLSPQDGSSTTDQRPTFQWNPVSDPGGSGVDYYQIKVYDWDVSWGDIDDTTTATSYTPSEDIPFDTIYWKVRAYDDAGNEGPWSDEWTLHIVDLRPPAAPTFEGSPPGALYPNTYPSPADGPYTITVDYTHPSGRDDLQYVYLQLQNGDGGLNQTMMWGLTGAPAQWDGEGDHLASLGASKTNVTDGYRVTWSFKLDDGWTPSTNVDFRAWSLDDEDLQSPYASYNRNAIFDTGLRIYDARVVLLTDSNENGYYSELRLEWDADTGVTSREICVDVYTDDFIHIERYLGQTCYTIYGNSVDWHPFPIDAADSDLEHATWDFRLALLDSAGNSVQQYGANDDGDLDDVPIEANDEPDPVYLYIEFPGSDTTATLEPVRVRARLCRYLDCQNDATIEGAEIAFED